ncbi:integrin alpha-E isoform X2 [Cricetulus griseus]|uniref:Integrin alpha-E isoform X2 n=1 Tax=Cricetulus griseus TaxID=10029 RepID=A0A9J7H5K4_CRIGR|nr:integrin alpha-E isoform X2 [Cricetulus griseus]
MADLMPLGAFNVDVAWPWVTALKPGAPSVLSSFLHHDPSTNQTCLLVTRHSTKKTSAPLHRCAISIIPDEIACHPVENISMPKGSYKGVTVVRNHHGILVCIQVQARQPSSLNSELTGACSLLSPSLDLQAHAYFSDLERLLDPDLHVELGGYSRSKGGSSGENKKPARGPRAAEEEEDEEEEAGTEIAIVLDGSGSIEPEDFQRAKDFISNMMRNVYEKCFECSFALVQYGYVIQTEFDLRDSQDVMASLARVQSIVQVKNVTKTASAMQHVLDNIFTPSRGSRKKASKVMVVLTDGDIFGDPLNLTTVINSPKMQGIERFAIGVGDAFKKAKTDRELKLIASDPKETHTFKVTNYMALDGLLSKLQQSIIHMEGTVGDALQYQLAQTGFSAQILDKGQVLLGTVGAFNWSGGALLYDTRSRRGSFLNQTAEDSGAAQYSYLGYSVAVLHMVFGFSYVAGAPRHKIRGAVFQLQKEDRKATFVRRLEGEQMGSYFGSELCSVDIDMDGTTDFLLVAAPFYHIRGEEGRVYVYRVHEQDASFSLARTLSGHPGLTNSRFGFAMAAVGDINQDKFTDVAIGAPLEGFEAGDGTSYGSVYIYNGHSDGLRASPSQRIRASSVALGLHYFGLSVAGGLDSNGDGLADITVGSRDRAAVLRSQPVVDLAVSMTFIPAALPMFFKDNVDVELCFEVASSTTASNPGLREMSLNFTVDVDVTKQRKRLQCTNTTNCQSYLRNWNGESSQCEQLSFIPMEEKLCDGDCFSNITIKVSYEFQTLGGKGDHPNPILDHYKDPSAVFQLPYEKDCKNKVFCIAEVQLTTAISQQELVVGVTKELTMNISLTNSGEDSYMTNMALNYPRNLQFKRIQKPLSPDIQCDEPKPVASVLVVNCKIGHPILKRSSANVSVIWQLEERVFPNRTADITVTISNSNEKSLARETHSLQFRHAFFAALSRPSVMYMNTSQSPSDHKEFLFNVHGENLFGAVFQLQICIPIKLQTFQIIRVKHLTKTQAHTECTQSQERACGSDPVQHVQEWHSVICDITSNKENVTVAAEISLGHTKQLLRDVTELQILGEISFNKSLYEGLSAENHRTQITVIFLRDEEPNSLPLIIGSSIGGLLLLVVIIAILFKCGFFKRKYQQLNLESIRRTQLKADSLLVED